MQIRDKQVYNEIVSSYRAEAVVIKTSDFGEADKILTLYTRQKGKVSTIAKGVKRVESRKSGSVDLLSHSVLFLAEGKNLDIILEAQLINPFRRIKEDLNKASLGYQVAELVDQFNEEKLENQSLFKLLVKALEKLDQAIGKSESEKVIRAFEIKFLSLSGFRPQLVQCVNCNHLLHPANNRFSARLGGVLCAACANTDLSCRQISNETVKIMRFLADEHWDQIERLSYPNILNLELEQQTRYYLEYWLEKELKSSKFVEKVNGVTSEK